MSNPGARCIVAGCSHNGPRYRLAIGAGTVMVIDDGDVVAIHTSEPDPPGLQHIGALCNVHGESVALSVRSAEPIPWKLTQVLGRPDHVQLEPLET